MRRKTIGLAQFEPASQLVGSAARRRDNHHVARHRILRHDPCNTQITFHISKTTTTKLVQLTTLRPCLRYHTHDYPLAATRKPFSRSAIKSSESSIPVEIRSSVSEIPAAARASGAIPACVMVAAWEIKLSTPPKDSASVNNDNPLRKRRSVCSSPSSSKLNIAPNPFCWRAAISCP